MLQEDPGGQDYLARIWQYGIKERLADRGRARSILSGSRPARPASSQTTRSRPGSSTPRRILGRGWYLLDAQVHKANPDPELVEFGQYLALFVPSKGHEHDDDHHKGKHDDDKNDGD